MALVQPQTVQPGGVAVMPDYTTTTRSGAIKTRGIVSAEAEAEEAHRKQIGAQQDQIDLDAQREWAEGDAAEKAAAQAEQAEIRRQTLETEREEQLQVKRTAQRDAEEDAEKKANLGDYWDTQSTPKRIFAAVLMGLSKGEPGGAADIYKDASARYRQGEIDKFNAATLAAKGRAGDTANHEEDTKRFMLELSTKETARDNLLKKRLATFVAQQPKAATAGAKLTAEMEVNQAKNKIAQENIFKQERSQSVVEGKAAPMGGGGPNNKEIVEVVDANERATQLEAFEKLARENPGAVAEVKKIREELVTQESLGKAVPAINSIGVASGAARKSAYDSASPKAKLILDAQAALFDEKVRQKSAGSAPNESDIERAREELAFHSMGQDETVDRIGASARAARNRANALNANSKAGQAQAPAAPAPPVVDRKHQVRALQFLKKNEKALKEAGTYERFRKENGL